MVNTFILRAYDRQSNARGSKHIMDFALKQDCNRRDGGGTYMVLTKKLSISRPSMRQVAVA